MGLAYAWQMITDQYVATPIYIKIIIWWKLLKKSAIIMISVGLRQRILKTCFEKLTYTQYFFLSSLSLPSVLVQEVLSLYGAEGSF